jgi:uncharacterized protein YggE
MKTQSVAGTVLLIVVAGLLVWNALDTRPAAPMAVASESAVARSVSVSGSSAIRVQPDRVVVVFGIETFAKTPSGSQAENAELSRKVLDTIRAHGVKERDIATDHFNLQPEYEDGYYHRRIVGYWTLNTIAVTLRDVEKLEPVMIAALEAGATSVDGVEFSVTNLRELRDEARELAVKAALEKAQAMATAAGVRLGNVTSISENDWHYGYLGYWRISGRQWTNNQNVVQDLATEGAITLEDGSISLGQIVVKAQVGITAEIVPN